jgi:SAM-dependent methyltransferase
MPSERVDLSRRAILSEWMDEPCTYEEFRDCLRDLAQLNRVTLAHRPTLRFLDGLTSHARPANDRPLHVVDVGCGGGDLLRLLEARARRLGWPVVLTGIDLNPFAARAAREFAGADSAIRWVTGDAFSYSPEIPIDCVVSSLFTHHLADSEIVRFLAWMERVTERGWFVNDLYRARFSYYGVQLLAAVAGWHRFVRHDAPVSIRRGFWPADWHGYLAAAGLDDTAVRMPGIGPARLCLARVKA